jgi:hypothetical protein
MPTLLKFCSWDSPRLLVLLLLALIYSPYGFGWCWGYWRQLKLTVATTSHGAHQISFHYMAGKSARALSPIKVVVSDGTRVVWSSVFNTTEISSWTARTSMTTITACSTLSQGTMPRLLFTWTGANLFPLALLCWVEWTTIHAETFNCCVSGCLGQTGITARQRLSRRMKGRSCRSPVISSTGS